MERRLDEESLSPSEMALAEALYYSRRSVPRGMLAAWPSCVAGTGYGTLEPVVRRLVSLDLAEEGEEGLALSAGGRKAIEKLLAMSSFAKSLQIGAYTVPWTTFWQEFFFYAEGFSPRMNNLLVKEAEVCRVEILVATTVRGVPPDPDGGRRFLLLNRFSPLGLSWMEEPGHVLVLTRVWPYEREVAGDMCSSGLFRRLGVIDAVCGLRMCVASHPLFGTFERFLRDRYDVRLRRSGELTRALVQNGVLVLER